MRRQQVDLGNGSLRPIITLPPLPNAPTILPPNDATRTTTVNSPTGLDGTVITTAETTTAGFSSTDIATTESLIDCGPNGTLQSDNRCLCREGFATNNNQDALSFEYCTLPVTGNNAPAPGGGGSNGNTEISDAGSAASTSSSSIDTVGLAFLIFGVLTFLVVMGISCVFCAKCCCKSPRPRSATNRTRTDSLIEKDWSHPTCSFSRDTRVTGISSAKAI
ncbi:hypothetical protein SARC_00975 [Sphaeroforma arctica JP610]|uniref:Uncharacterized protein n=1 Tax=Sphaeroforma arctica JP610 TaxID=667725 RepID=A0A0L0GCY5_9EUKA|nr:hypothetical protein SARC_00975 [Sphaeroforma arctica JP610]KNC86880.1 hypothetical protein SARC_00975 [Sphaeroforma arctica JP610]|eukprot:XP_014160782.1 hypothetical protein SARC_00975 [Sphaeroforma arctica JP610]